MDNTPTYSFHEEMDKRTKNITNELFSNGGTSQALFIIETLLCDGNLFSMEEVLRRVGNNFDRLNDKLKVKFITHIANFDFLAEFGREYVCLDTDLRLCVKKKGDMDWNDVTFVLPYADVSSIKRLIYDYYNNLDEGA